MLEDDEMDKRESMTFVEVTASEKRDVFQLPAVRRSMRYLQFSSVLMSSEMLHLSQKFMEVGPARSTLLHIGADAVKAQGSHCTEHTAREERYYIHPLFAVICNLRGYHPVMHLLGIGAIASDLAYHVAVMRNNDGADVVEVASFLAAFMFLFVHATHCIKPAWSRSILRAVDQDMFDVSLAGNLYLRLRGLEVLSTAQERACAENGKVVEKSASMRALSKRMIKAALIESLTVHFMVIGLPWMGAAAVSCVRHVQRGEGWLAAGAICALWGEFITCLSIAQISFCVRAGQKLSMLEIRRVQCDVRVVSPQLIHRVTPRFKSLLHESHAFANKAQKMFSFFLPITFVNVIQLVGGVWVANFQKEGEVEKEVWEEDEGGVCVPAWIFFSVFGPIVTLLVVIHGFGKLNLAIERDIDQDIVEMNIRLTYSEVHVPNWLVSFLFIPLHSHDYLFSPVLTP